MTIGLLLAPTAASAATTTAPTATIKPSADCKVPSLTVSPASATPGSKVTISGVNFSGCSVQGSSVKPTAQIPVKVGVVTATKMGEVLGSTTTTASGTFTIEVTVPALSSGSVAKVAIAAVAEDPATKLDYYAAAAINYPATSSTSPSSTSPSSSSVSSAPTTSQAVPTAVPAGSGGAGASGGRDAGLDLAVGGAGALLLGAGGLVLARRRAHQH